MRAIASAEARETTMWMGVVSWSGFCYVLATICLANGLGCSYPRKQLHAVSLDAMQTARLVQLPHGDGLGRIQPALVYPALYPVQVDGRHVHHEGIVLPPPPLGLGDAQRRLPTLEMCWYLAVRMLTLLTPPRCFAFAGCGSTTTPDLLVVCAFGVAEGREDGCAAVVGRNEQRRGGRCFGCDGEQREGEARGLYPW